MKKTLAILLSLALVICMIPVTAFAGVTQNTVHLGETDYTVSFDQDSFAYNAKGQAPYVTLTGSQSVPDVVWMYKKNDLGATASEEKPIEAGTYTVSVKLASAGVSDEGTSVGNFTIKQVGLSTTEIKAISTIDDAAFDIISTNGSNSTTLKDYFKLVVGNEDVLTDNYTLSAVASENSIEVTATSNGNGSFLNSTTTATFDKVTYLSGATITAKAGSTDFMYGAPTPELCVQIGGGTPLTKGEDYTVRLEGGTSVGSKVKAIVTGIGSYTGEATKEFEIIPFDLSKATYEPNPVSVAKGSTDLPFSVKAGTKVLTRGLDYTLGTFSTDTIGSGEGNKVTITGRGNYTESLNVPFTVVDSDSKDINSATLTMSTLTYNGLAQLSTPTLKIGSKEVSRNYYTIKYRKHNSGTFTTENPVDAGKYDVEVTLTSSGKTAGYYNGTPETYTSKVFDSALTVNQLDINSSSVTATYTGTPSYNPVKLQLGSKVLSYITDYTVDSYETYKSFYTVIGKGNFKGTRLVYTASRNLSSCSVNFTDNRSSVAYGPTYYPDVTVYYGSTKLIKGSDYTVTYKDAKNQTVSYCKETGTYSVVVTGIGAYTGTKTLYFTITGTDISYYTVTLKNPTVNATGSPQTPVIESVKYSNTSKLSTNDYTVSYQDSEGKTVTYLSAPGTYRVVVTGKNGYSGSTYATFRIVGTPQTIIVNQDSYKVYDDSASFKITAKATGDGTGFTYTSSNSAVASVSSTGYVTPHKVGKAVITVTTTGNKKSEPAMKDIIVKVYPDKAKLSKKPWTDGKRGQLKVRWGYQDGVTKYQVRYSRDKNFSSGSYLTKTVKAHGKDYMTQSTTLSNLKRGYTYYVKVRAVYTDPITGDNYYGSWSGWRSAKTI